MNDLSWLLYFADVCANFVGFVVALSLLSFVVVSVDSITANKVTVRPIVCLIPILWLVNVAMPSKNTVYAIAASELGEKVVASQLSAKAQKAIDAWLDRQISGGKYVD